MKYIVYKTTNLVNNKIYIGVHGTKDPEVFDGYIGCAIKGPGSIHIKHPKTAFHYAVAKYGFKNFKRETIKVFDTEEEAYTLEEFLVDEEFLARPDVYNMILGGRSTAITRKYIYMYNLEGQYITEFKGTRLAGDYLNVSNSCICRAVKYKLKCKNYLFSYDKHSFIDPTEYNIDSKSRDKIYIYNIDGKLIDECDSITETMKKYKIHNARIKESCILGILINDLHFSYIKEITFDKAFQKYTKNRIVYQYSNDGKFFKMYKTQEEAELENKGSNISKAIKSKSLCKNGYYWGLEKLEYYNKKPISKKKMVAKLDNNGIIIQTWNSGRDCEKEVGSGVRHVLHGLSEYHKGFRYSYI